MPETCDVLRVADRSHGTYKVVLGYDERKPKKGDQLTQRGHTYRVLRITRWHAAPQSLVTAHLRLVKSQLSWGRRFWYWLTGLPDTYRPLSALGLIYQ